MEGDMYPLQHSPYDDKHKSESEGENEKPYNGWQFLKDMAELSKKQALAECDHKDQYKVASGPYAFVRFCSRCGKSWRMWVKPDFPGEMPVAEWEEIAEPVEQRILPDYEE